MRQVVQRDIISIRFRWLLGLRLRREHWARAQLQRLPPAGRPRRPRIRPRRAGDRSRKKKRARRAAIRGAPSPTQRWTCGCSARRATWRTARTPAAAAWTRRRTPPRRRRRWRSRRSARRRGAKPKSSPRAPPPPREFVRINIRDRRTRVASLVDINEAPNATERASTRERVSSVDALRTLLDSHGSEQRERVLLRDHVA